LAPLDSYPRSRSAADQLMDAATAERASDSENGGGHGMLGQYCARRTEKAYLQRFCYKLGSRDSDPDRVIQSDECCRLHHSPLLPVRVTHRRNSNLDLTSE